MKSYLLTLSPTIQLLCGLAFGHVQEVDVEQARPGLLQARLSHPRAGNFMCLKLISPENRMMVSTIVFESLLS